MDAKHLSSDIAHHPDRRAIFQEGTHLDAPNIWTLGVSLDGLPIPRPH
jgi:hypothetical protein